MAWMPVLLAEVTDEGVADLMDSFFDFFEFIFALIKWSPLIIIGVVLLIVILPIGKNDDKGTNTPKKRHYTANDYAEDDEEEEEDPWAWKREYDRRRRYEAQREARRAERRKSRYDDYGRDEERETHYGEEHDVDENGYCHDCDCEEDDLI